MRVLAIGAHPDDIEILCGGTLARYVNQGDQVIIGIITDGSAGSTQINSDELKKIRKLEAEKTAKQLNADFIWLGEPDELVFDNIQTRTKVVDLIRKGNPDIIITHDKNDYHPDHVMTNKMVTRASFVATLPNIKSEFDPIKQVVPIFFMDTLAGIDFQPNVYVNISEYFEKKIQLIKNHKSQVKWLKDHDDIDIIEFVRIQNSFRGLQSGVKQAEAFRSFDAWPRLKTKRYLP